ncbi:c-type cytochrome [Roseiflexus sp.]|uniref:c-type cytochrome n=1 Tax=Roseiflexus sp. TaxID=2562120 RepID=UPI00398B54F7
MLNLRQCRRPGTLVGRMIRAGWLVAAALLMTACHLEMYDQAKYKPQQASEIFADGAAARPLVENTVARGRLRIDAVSVGRVDGEPNGAYVTTIPIQITPELLARGAERYRIYCAVCHGVNGNGRGQVGLLLNPRPPSFYDQRLLDMPDGEYYDVLVNGRGTMYAYGYRVQSISDRWAIVAHIRELQKNPPQQN